MIKHSLEHLVCASVCMCVSVFYGLTGQSHCTSHSARQLLLSLFHDSNLPLCLQQAPLRREKSDFSRLLFRRPSVFLLLVLLLPFLFLLLLSRLWRCKEITENVLRWPLHRRSTSAISFGSLDRNCLPQAK